MLCIVTARMTSKRLPGKPLRELAGRELLGRVLDRVNAAQSASEVIVATSTHRTDDPVKAFCDKEATRCFRGSMNDVTGRLLAAALSIGAQAFVRISGDSPVVDPQLIDCAVDVYGTTCPDLATNVYPKTFPAGQSVEVINAYALQELWSQQRDSVDAAQLNEHVTLGFYKSPRSWNIANFTSGLSGPHPSMAVDTLGDLMHLAALLHRASGGPTGWRDLLALSVDW